MAISKHRLPMLGMLINCGACIEQNCTRGSTPLLAACTMGYLEGVQLLVERGANLKARSADGRTCLLVALGHGYYPIVDHLLNQNTCEVNEKGRDGASALHHAVLLNYTDLTSRLLQKQANVNTQNLVRHPRIVQ